MKARKKLILSSLALPLIWIIALKLVFYFPVSFPQDFNWFIGGIVGTILALFLSYKFSEYNGIPLYKIGLKWESKTPKKLIVGLLIGSTITCLMLLSFIIFTDLEVGRFEGANIPMALFWMLAIIPLAFMEEVAFRGFSFFSLEKTIGLRYTIIITSILFAYYHDMTGATFISQLIGPGVWGIIYGVGAIWSKGLGMPTGIHIGANLVSAAFGLKDSNYTIWVIDYKSEITESMRSNTELIGLICQLTLFVFGIFMMEWYIKNRKPLKNKP